MQARWKASGSGPCGMSGCICDASAWPVYIGTRYSHCKTNKCCAGTTSFSQAHTSHSALSRFKIEPVSHSGTVLDRPTPACTSARQAGCVSGSAEPWGPPRLLRATCCFCVPSLPRRWGLPLKCPRLQHPRRPLPHTPCPRHQHLSAAEALPHLRRPRLLQPAFSWCAARAPHSVASEERVTSSAAAVHAAVQHR